MKSTDATHDHAHRPSTLRLGIDWEIRDSPLGGRGGFALRCIERGEVIARYDGEIRHVSDMRSCPASEQGHALRIPEHDMVIDGYAMSQRLAPSPIREGLWIPSSSEDAIDGWACMINSARTPNNVSHVEGMSSLRPNCVVHWISQRTRRESASSLTLPVPVYVATTSIPPNAELLARYPWRLLIRVPPIAEAP
jgi:hypothetical protein